MAEPIRCPKCGSDNVIEWSPRAGNQPEQLPPIDWAKFREGHRLWTQGREEEAFKEMDEAFSWEAWKPLWRCENCYHIWERHSSAEQT